jgi:hypothetical protein
MGFRIPVRRILYHTQSSSADCDSFFRSKFHCFDATVIIASFIIDVLLRGILEEVASLVIILRLWRVFKIMEELSVGAQEQTEALRERIELLEQEKSQMEVELTRLKSRAQGS